jgi:SAM-dependent methyltransferase
LDAKTVEGFGQEWTSFDQSALSQDDLRGIFEEYFELFRWDKLPRDAVGFDLGCGSGRWARFVAPRVGKLHCIDASEAAVKVAKRTLQGAGNCEFHVASVDAIPIPDGTMDFGYALGVIHTLPDPASGIKSCAVKLKPDAPFLIYTYYALENRPAWFRALWTASDLMRRGVSRLPYRPRLATATSLALGVYWPLARLALLAESLGLDVRNFPLTAYRRRGFYTMRNDALDRFGTRVEHRFTADQIREMMSDAGLDRIVFSENNFWCAVGYKKA